VKEHLPFYELYILIAPSPNPHAIYLSVGSNLQVNTSDSESPKVIFAAYLLYVPFLFMIFSTLPGDFDLGFIKSSLPLYAGGNLECISV